MNEADNFFMKLKFQALASAGIDDELENFFAPAEVDQLAEFCKQS
jgi:hypothetical protein